MSQFMRENSHLYPSVIHNQPLTQRYHSNKDILVNGSNSSRFDGYHSNQNHDDTLMDDLNLFSKTQINVQYNSNNSNQETPLNMSKQMQLQSSRLLGGLEKSVSLPQLNLTNESSNIENKTRRSLERSQVEPYLMNIKFSRQTKRKGIDAKDVNENRFENFNRLPGSLSTNKKLIWNLKFDKMKQRETKEWGDVQSSNGQIYDLVDPEKYKFKKTFIAKIKADESQANNGNHYRLKNRYY